MTAVRRATPADVPALVKMGRRFVSEAFGFPYDDEAAERYIGSVVKDGVVFVADRAMLGAILYPLPFTANHVVAYELFWWSEGRSGGKLLLEFERWARRQNAHRIVVSTVEGLPHSPAAKMFARRGYRRAEQAWIKEAE